MNTIITTPSVSLDTILKSKEIYHSAFDLSCSPQAIVSLDRRIMRANRAFSTVTGYREIDLMSLTLQDILIPDPGAHGSMLGPKEETAAGTSIDADFIRKNGTIRRGRFWFHLMKDRDTGPVCWILIMEDLTVAQAAEEATGDYHLLFNTFISRSNDCITFLDANGLILYLNKASLVQLGVTRQDEAINRKYVDFWPTMERAAVDMSIRLAEKGMTSSFQGRTTASGKERWWDIEINPMAGGSDGIQRLMVVSRDITALKSAEQALSAMKEEKEELALALEKTGTALHEKETLLREIHHRVKNNMQSLSCLINLQSAQIDDRAAAGMLQNCRERICSMSKVYEKLSLSENLSHIDFRDYTAELAAELLKSHGKKDSVHISTDIDDIFLGIQDAVSCGLLITEIISNALRHAFPDGRTGEIIIQFKESHQGIYSILIRDNGIGFPEDLDINSATTLGMILINELIKQIKGNLTVISSGGTGYSIRFKKRPEPETAGCINGIHEAV